MTSPRAAVWPPLVIPHMMSVFRIAAAILNAFHEGIESDKGDSETIARSILTRLNEPNRLASLVEGQRLKPQICHFKGNGW